MPIPKFEFEDADAGLPRQPVPVRFACMAADWTPALLAEVVLGEMNEGYSLLAVHEYDPATNWEGIVQPHTYEPYRQYRNQSLRDQLAKLPPNHFVWSDELVWAFSDFIDRTIGRESAAGLGIRWQPALGDCADIVAESIDLSGISETPAPQYSIHVQNSICDVHFQGKASRFKDSTGFKYIRILLARPDKEVAVQALASTSSSLPDSGFLLAESVRQNLGKTGITIGNLGSATDAIDDTALTQSRARMLEIMRLVEAGEVDSETEKNELHEEREKIAEWLRANVNNKGKPRREIPEHEAARKAVFNAISRTISELKIAHPPLGQHLAKCIRTGSFCSYSPPAATQWTFLPPGIP